MEDLSLHVLDITENSINSGADRIRIELIEEDDRLQIAISDNGAGMDEEVLARSMDPFFTSKAGKSYGLGLSLLRQAAEETGGSISVTSATGSGTTVVAEFMTRHPDMKPKGDIPGAVRLMRAFHPEIDFILTQRDERKGGENETQT